MDSVTCVTPVCISAASLLVLATQKEGPDPASILGADSWKNIQKITLENVMREQRTNDRSHTSHDNHRRMRGRKQGGHEGTGRAVIRTSLTTTPHNSPVWKKPSIKPKPTSFDDAMKQKIVGDLNKVTPQNYDSILKSLHGVCSRLSDDEHPWALRLILENATRQHVFATTYVRLYKDIAKSRSEDVKTANEILTEFMTVHIEKILTSIDNGDNYDEFCAANKMKTKLAGHSIVLAEAANIGIVPLSILGPHATGLVGVLGTIIESANNKTKEIPRETTENGKKCILDFFKTLAKTKADKEGFQKCVISIRSIVDQEKKDKYLSPKARFALMDFVEEMTKAIVDIKRSKTVYRPGMYANKPTSGTH